MPIFQYTALTRAGKTHKGIIDADTPRDARLKLRADKIHVTDMREVSERTPRGKKKGAGKTKEGGRERKKRRLIPFEGIQLEKRVKIRDLATFTRQFATLLRSGIQLADAVGALVEQATDRDMEKMLRNVKEDITGGASLAEAFARHPRYFNDLYVNMVRAGEASGNLDEVLARVAQYIQKQASLRGKVAAAVTYPVVMIVVGTGVVIFLMSYVVPRITTILKQRNQPMPWITEVLIVISDFFRDYWWILLVAAVGIAFRSRPPEVRHDHPPPAGVRAALQQAGDLALRGHLLDPSQERAAGARLAEDRRHGGQQRAPDTGHPGHSRPHHRGRRYRHSHQALQGVPADDRLHGRRRRAER
jgi:general secretion pathway protein F